MIEVEKQCVWMAQRSMIKDTCDRPSTCVSPAHRLIVLCEDCFSEFCDCVQGRTKHCNTAKQPQPFADYRRLICYLLLMPGQDTPTPQGRSDDPRQLVSHMHKTAGFLIPKRCYIIFASSSPPCWKVTGWLLFLVAMKHPYRATRQIHYFDFHGAFKVYKVRPPRMICGR